MGTAAAAIDINVDLIVVATAATEAIAANAKERPFQPQAIGSF
jgi:hypothetical protein